MLGAGFRRSNQVWNPEDEQTEQLQNHTGRKRNQRKTPGRCCGGAQPPNLPIEKIGGGRAGQLRWQTQCGGERKSSEASSSPKQALGSIDLAMRKNKAREKQHA